VGDRGEGDLGDIDECQGVFVPGIEAFAEDPDRAEVGWGDIEEATDPDGQFGFRGVDPEADIGNAEAHDLIIPAGGAMQRRWKRVVKTDAAGKTRPRWLRHIVPSTGVDRVISA
jgi:hypothetical protein